MAAALGDHAADAARGPRLCFHLKPDSYDTVSLIEVLTQLGGFYAGERVMLLWDGLERTATVPCATGWDTQDSWLTVERLLAYAPERNPVEPLPTSKAWSWPTSLGQAGGGRRHRRAGHPSGPATMTG